MRQWNGQVKINKDILTYSEHGIGGLSLKQTVFGGLAIVATILVYFLGSKFFGNQITLILCGLVAAPLAAVGFISYNGMSFTQLVAAVFSSKSSPSVLYFQSKSYYSAMIPLAKYLESQKEEKKQNDAKNI